MQFLLNSFGICKNIFRMFQVVRFLGESPSHPKYLCEEMLEFRPVRASRGSGIEFAALTSSERALIRHVRRTSGSARFHSEFFEPEPEPSSPVAQNPIGSSSSCVVSVRYLEAKRRPPARPLVTSNQYHSEKLEINVAIQPETPPRLAEF